MRSVGSDKGGLNEVGAEAAGGEGEPSGGSRLRWTP